MDTSVATQQSEVSQSLTPKTRQWILLACCLAAMAVLVDPPLWAFDPPKAQLFDAELAFARLLTSISGIATAIFLLGGGLLGDFYGRRRMLLIGLCGAMLANTLIMLSPNTWWFGVFRIAEAIFGAMVLPLALALLFMSFGENQRGIALASFATCSALATQIAWIQGSLLASHVGWRSPFILPIALAITTIVIILKRTPETSIGHGRLQDTFAYMGWTLVVLAMLYGLLALPVNPDLWQPITTIIVFVAVCGIGLVLWAHYHRRSRAVSARRQRRTWELVALVITGVLLNFALVGVGVRFFGYFQVEMGMGMILAGVALAPMLVGVLLGLFVIISNVKKRQARLVIAAGFLAMGLSIAVMALLTAAASYWVYFVLITIFGLGYILAATVWMNVFLHTGIHGYFGLSAAINKSSSVIGAALGAVVTGNLLVLVGNRTYEEILRQQVNPAPGSDAAELARTAFDSILAASPSDVLDYLAVSRPDLLNGYLTAYEIAFDTTMWLMAALCILAAVVIALGLRRSLRAEPTEMTDANEELRAQLVHDTAAIAAKT